MVADHFAHGARRVAVVDGIEDQQAIGFLHVGQQVEALRAAVHQRHLRREGPAGVERLDAAHAEAFVGPQDVADAEDENAFGFHHHVPKKTPRSREGASRGQRKVNLQFRRMARRCRGKAKARRQCFGTASGDNAARASMAISP